MADKQLNVVLCWHMHQPFYREGLDGQFQLPWVYLHGLKDYTDMVAHLEQHPNMRAVVDFAPVLLEQIDTYVNELQAWLERGTAMSDPMLNLLAGIDPIPTQEQARQQLISDCRRCNPRTMVDPYPAFRRLLNWIPDSGEDVQESEPSPCKGLSLYYLSDAYFIDLMVWYHLAWTGNSMREHATVKQLFAKQSGYTMDDRRALLALVHEQLASIIPRYRALAERGQIELAMTPYAHPIVPLLNDFANMRCAIPDAQGPDAERYPGGSDRSRWHMQYGIELFEQHFGLRPAGVWLSEGGVSADALAILEEFDIAWTASGEGVWKNCYMQLSEQNRIESQNENLRRDLFRPYQYRENATRLFFRDDGLSDLIGFEYQHWPAEQAAQNFGENLQNIANFLGEDVDRHVVSIILDGENAWEHYPDNGQQFLHALYQEMAEHPAIKLSTFSELVPQIKPRSFDQICSGSWIYGSFSTWIGEKDKNSAWEALVSAKQVYDQVLAGDALDEEQKQLATRQLAICESSDWFWWFGDYNPADSVSDFDRMFRSHLRSLYQLLNQTPPASLEQPFSGGNQFTSDTGAMRRAH